MKWDKLNAAGVSLLPRFSFTSKGVGFPSPFEGKFWKTAVGAMTVFRGKQKNLLRTFPIRLRRGDFPDRAIQNRLILLLVFCCCGGQRNNAAELCRKF
ncbi:MAG: hypothetical protein MR004_00655 [Clostridiales bacterium]|nr:hypothetical protein [bacterium 210917-SL.2.15]MCI5842170.1 hypothetical protein [Clostridiales bacterium]MDY4037250.1 hypothetical protein [Candidatus Pseudoscilispira sp.]